MRGRPIRKSKLNRARKVMTVLGAIGSVVANDVLVYSAQKFFGTVGTVSGQCLSQSIIGVFAGLWSCVVISKHFPKFVADLEILVCGLQDAPIRLPRFLNNEELM